MTFLTPVYLWLLLLLVVPLILYLLPMPRRRLATAALYLWERFLEKEPFGKASERTRRAVGFALLAAIFVCLILAAAEMAVGRATVTAKKVIVVMDVSGSMNAINETKRYGETNLAASKHDAKQLVESLGGGSEVVVVESAETMRTVVPMGPPNAETLRAIDAIKPYDGATKLTGTLEQAFALWGGDAGAEAYVFTDRTLPASKWEERAHAWIAPSAGDNLAVTSLQARRKGKLVEATAVVANFGRAARNVILSVLCNGEVRDSFSMAVQAGQTASKSVRFEETSTAEVEVRIEKANDALPTDDSARATVPATDSMNVAVLWPETTTADGRGEAKKKNEFVAAVLAALQADGAMGSLNEDGANSAATVYVNRMPEAWPKGGAIILYPLRAGVLPIAGMQREVMTVTHQADDSLLQDVDLRGLAVKDAIRCDVPEWARPLVWSNETPLVWAGQTGETKVLFVGIPIVPSGSRLPVVTGFPVLMRNALHWMLPQPSVRGVLSAEVSDLRRPAPVATATMGVSPRRSLATVLVLAALALLAVEWGLFHKRLTE